MGGEPGPSVLNQNPDPVLSSRNPQPVGLDLGRVQVLDQHAQDRRDDPSTNGHW